MALTIGGVGLASGSVTYGMARAKADDLDARCDDGTCPPGESDSVDDYNALKTASTIGFIVAGLGLTTGVVVLLAAPSGDSGERSGAGFVGARVGLGSISLVAGF